MDLLDRFETLFPDVVVDYLTGDREFVGKAGLSYLLMDKPILFRLRIRESDNICAGAGQTPIRASRLFSSLSVGETRILSGRHWVWGRPVYVIGTRLKSQKKSDDYFLILICEAKPQTALSDYARRWGIETLFGALKTRGFCLESTHFTDPDRLSKLLALLVLAFVWAMKTGLWQHSLIPILSPRIDKILTLFCPVLGFSWELFLISRGLRIISALGK